jgi:hypothetical protein
MVPFFLNIFCDLEPYHQVQFDCISNVPLYSLECYGVFIMKCQIISITTWRMLLSLLPYSKQSLDFF